MLPTASGRRSDETMLTDEQLEILERNRVLVLPDLRLVDIADYGIFMSIRPGQDDHYVIMFLWATWAQRSRPIPLRDRVRYALSQQSYWIERTRATQGRCLEVLM